LVNELKLNPQTEVKINDIDVEVLKGKLSEKPWFIESKGENYVLLEEAQYAKIIEFLNKILDENIELKLEQRIMSEFPVDFEDVKTVVKKEMDESKLNIVEAVKKVRKKYPNLFHNPIEIPIDFENLLQEII
jgi:hypothetical protein